MSDMKLAEAIERAEMRIEDAGNKNFGEVVFYASNLRPILTAARLLASPEMQGIIEASKQVHFANCSEEKTWQDWQEERRNAADACESLGAFLALNSKGEG